jgi:hypothetical protein
MVVGVALIIVGATPTRPSTLSYASLISTGIVHVILRATNITGEPVWGAQVGVFTLNPASHLARLAVANPTVDLVQDENFTTNDLVIGPTVNDTVAIGPRDGDLILTTTNTNQSGFAQFNITAGVYLINIYDEYDYFNIITHLHAGWAETLKLKPAQYPSPESYGPYVHGRSIITVDCPGENTTFYYCDTGYTVNRPLVLLGFSIFLVSLIFLLIETTRGPKPFNGSEYTKGSSTNSEQVSKSICRRVLAHENWLRLGPWNY